MLFCGTSEDPLLVQRIGRNREAAARAEEAAPTGAGALSGAAAAPSLGYAQRGRSASERLLVEAAEQAMARLWQVLFYSILNTNPNPNPNPNPSPSPSPSPKPNPDPNQILMMDTDMFLRAPVDPLALGVRRRDVVRVGARARVRLGV